MRPAQPRTAKLRELLDVVKRSHRKEPRKSPSSDMAALTTQQRREPFELGTRSHLLNKRNEPLTSSPATPPLSSRADGPPRQPLRGTLYSHYPEPTPPSSFTTSASPCASLSPVIAQLSRRKAGLGPNFDKFPSKTITASYTHATTFTTLSSPTRASNPFSLPSGPAG